MEILFNIWLWYQKQKKILKFFIFCVSYVRETVFCHVDEHLFVVVAAVVVVTVVSSWDKLFFLLFLFVIVSVVFLRIFNIILGIQKSENEMFVKGERGRRRGEIIAVHFWLVFCLSLTEPMNVNANAARTYWNTTISFSCLSSPHCKKTLLDLD